MTTKETSKAKAPAKPKTEQAKTEQPETKQTETADKATDTANNPAKPAEKPAKGYECQWQLQHNGKTYKAGDTVQLTDEEANSLKETGVIKGDDA